MQWGSEGVGPSRFIHLHGIAVDNDDRVYVSDARDNSRVSKFDIEGNLLSSWGSLGSEKGQFKEHHGIDFDSLGNVYVADTGNRRIQIFSPDGEFLREWNSSASGTQDDLVMPQDIAIDSFDNVYISDVGDAHPEISYVEAYLNEHQNLTSTECD
jgi:DNA-binding beta-propeller fold protein YncE